MARQTWTEGRLLQDKTIVVTGCASGIGWETAKLVKALGGDVIGVDINRTEDHVDELYIADLSDRMAIKALVNALPSGIDGIANIAGLPPTAPADMVLKVNLVGLKFFTNAMIGRLNDGASIVNLASLAGFGWEESIPAIKASETLAFEDVEDFIKTHNVGNEVGRSYFFSKEAVVAWTIQNRWTWRDRGIRMNAVSPAAVDTPILKDFLATLGPRGEEGIRLTERPGRPEEIAPVVAFLMSDMTHWIRGTNIPVDGGMASHFLAQRHQL
ncbi:coniferyl-alcohol dehydrogenase [Roseibium aggregatum]|uniref:coniferyl-alcohol dehydrogenase n=1 Tax=Roseibium aggregatum TaxID=187304 RepID=UPI001AD8E542|nr:coniferyl-alcohol dehydrogenase [Roseibium aggregatum]